LKKNKILIARGTEFIGYHLAKKCLCLNWNKQYNYNKKANTKNNI